MASNPNAERKSKPNSRQNTTSDRQSPQQEVKQSDSPQEPRSPQSVSLSIHLVRLIICGLGASTIAGTAISMINPPKHATKIEPLLPPPKSSPFDRLKLTQANLSLKDRLQAVNQKSSNLDPSYVFADIDSGEYSELGIDRVLPAASTIKLPILIALFQDVDAQKVKLAEKLTIDKKSIAEGSGDLQEQKPGTQVSILVAATKMIAISDNTATNLLIDRLGGAAMLNQRFRQWGLKVTAINQPLPDLKGTNLTTARELAQSMMAIDRGKIVSDSSRIQILSMMSNVTRNTMLPKGLGVGAKIAHKTGDIGSLIADVGSIELPTGKKYIAAVLVKRAHNDPAGPLLVRQMSKIAYEHFQHPLPTSISGSKFQPKTDSEFPRTVFIKRKD